MRVKNSIDVLDKPKGTSAIKTILWATFVAGTLDALAGVTVYWLVLGRMNVIQVLQWIASGVFGTRAFDGGLWMAFNGNIFHYFIAFLFTGGYFLVSPYFPILKKNGIVTGILYGAFVWLIMNIIVIPLSNVPPAPFETHVAIMGILWHMFLVGIPIVRIINAYYIDQWK